MYTIRNEPDPDQLAQSFGVRVGKLYERLLQQDEARRNWWYAVARHGVDVGCIGVHVSPTCPREYLGRLPPREAFIVGPFMTCEDAEYLDAGHRLVSAARNAIQDEIPESLQVVVNREHHADWDRRCKLFRGLGMSLFQEKQGFGWHRSQSPPTEVTRLALASVEDTGMERFREVLGRCGEGTLDRNDRWYREHAGPDNWSAVMTMYAPDDRQGWLVAADDQGNDVGVVAVSSFDANTATIIFVGVVPEHRGNGYINDLVRAATAAALRGGYSEMLSDADVLNEPMTSAFIRNGHRDDHRPWHKWHYRDW